LTSNSTDMPAFFAFIVALFVMIHPYYVSITTILVNEDEQAVQVTSKIFVNDLELGIQEAYGIDSLYIATRFEHEDADKWIGKYITDHLKIEADGEQVELSFLGKEHEYDVVWCYLEAQEVSGISTLKVENTMLIALYTDQMNITHLEYGDDIRRSFLLGIEKTVAETTFDRD